MKKALRLLLLTTLLICALSGFAAAAEPADAEEAAAELAALGLLRGTSQGFALEEPCNRLQGAVLFTRLLGQEQEALSRLRPHPFADIGSENWAAPYVAYLYNQGLAYGVGSHEYGAGPMQPHQFATFCLRALDYTEGNENSDFKWSGALDFMVEQQVISGSLRNRLSATPVFRRGDAVLLIYATLIAPLKEGGQTLLQRLVANGAVTAEQAAALNAAPDDLRIAYPAGLLAEEVLAAYSAQSGQKVGRVTYAPGPEAEEEIYRQLRQPERTYDLCLVPGYVVEWLRADGFLSELKLRDFGGETAFTTAVRDNPYWYDTERRSYYALPLAFTVPCLYYNSSRVQNPDWSFLFRASYSGGVYMPADPTVLIPLALHYYSLPYDTAEDKKLLPAVKLLSEQAASVPAYLNQHMLDIAEREDAALGVISSRDLPELNRRQEAGGAYSGWRAVLPPSGGPITVYYAVIPQNGDIKAATALLTELLQPQTAAANAQQGGYFPAVRGADSYLSGAIAAAQVTARGENCRLLNLEQQSRVFFNQTMVNALLDEAQNTVQPALDSLEFSFESQGQVYRSCRVDFTAKQSTTYRAGAEQSELLNISTRKLVEPQLGACKKELTRLGIALWKDYYDGPADGPQWTLTLSFAEGGQKICRGYGLPPTWPDVAMALLTLTGEDMLPITL